MPETEAISPFIRTKLFGPEVVSDLVSRPALLNAIKWALQTNMPGVNKEKV
jgi:hypothetical protein